MLTRLEINGFKNLLDLKVDFGPFTCIAGPNGSGKSNIFDCIHFLSLLADHEIMTAAQMVRSNDGRAEDPRHLFWTDGIQRADKMSFAVEMIVPKTIRDDFGRIAKATATFVRYELELGYEEPSPDFGGLGRITLLSENLRQIQKNQIRDHLQWSHGKKAFRDRMVGGSSKDVAFISSEIESGARVIRVHEDRGSRSNSNPWPADTAPRTIVCTTATASAPTILAARREMQSWRLLMLEPSAMRSPDSFFASSSSQKIEANGAHLASALYRQAMTPRESGKPEPDEVYNGVATLLSNLVDVVGVRVDRDDRRQLLTLEVQQPKGGFLPARSLSDGTLRFLALCIMGKDPTIEGVLCMEEPENGIHPERIPAMVELVRGLAFDRQKAPSETNPFRQVIVNTHSPLFVQLQNAEDLLFAKSVTIRGPNGQPERAVRLLPVRGDIHSKNWRIDESMQCVGRTEIMHYLTTPVGGQLTIDDYVAA
jgi:predicted ATPase